MLETKEYVCEICSERVTLHEGDSPTCPVCGNDSLEEDE